MPIYDEKYLSSFASWHEFIVQESIEEYKQRVNSFFCLKLPKKQRNISMFPWWKQLSLIHSILTNIEYEQSRYSILYLESFKLNIIS